MDLSSISDPALLQSFLDGLSWEPWKSMGGDANSVTFSNLTSSQVIILKGQNLVRLAYRMNDNYVKGGKIRATFAIDSKLAALIVKMEQTIKGRLVSSGMMKKGELNAKFQSIVTAPTEKYPSHVIHLQVRIDSPKTVFTTMTETEGGSSTSVGWSSTPVEYEMIQKFSLMSLRIVPMLIWKNSEKCALKWLIKQGVVAHEDEIPQPVDEVISIPNSWVTKGWYVP